MPTETELREALQGEPDEPAALDTARIIRRARARRLPKQLAIGIGGGLAAVALVVPVVLGAGSLGLIGSGSAADQGAADHPVAEGEVALEPSPAEALNRCGAAASVLAGDAAGLVLSVEAEDAAAGADRIRATLTLTNAGDAPATGVVNGSPVMTLAADGVVVGHGAPGAVDGGREIALDPGESVSFSVVFAPVPCAAADADEQLRTDPPPLAPGAYTLSAAIGFSRGDGSDPRLVTGPASPVTLR